MLYSSDNGTTDRPPRGQESENTMSINDKHDPAETLRFAQAVAAELGPDWTAAKRYDSATLTDGSVVLFVGTDSYYNAKRYEISDSYPEGTRGDVLRYDENDAHAKTTVALDRAPKAVARQIERAVLPTVRKWAPIIAERIAAQGRAKDNRTAALATIRELVPGAWVREEGGSDIRLYTSKDYHGSVELRHDADGGSVKLGGLTFDQILAILLIAEGK